MHSADRESFSPQRCGHLIIGDFGLAYGGVSLEPGRHGLNPGCYSSSIFKNRRDYVRISARRVIGFVS